jgi:hypothetical protein
MWKYLKIESKLKLVGIFLLLQTIFCSAFTSNHRVDPTFNSKFLPSTSITTRNRPLDATHGLTRLMNYYQGDQEPYSRERQSLQDMVTLVIHFLSCFFFAVVISFYEGYDCAYLKPETATIRKFPSLLWGETNGSVIRIMNYGTRGMGRGELDRANGWYQDTYYGFQDENDSERTIRAVRSYNEILEVHRKETVPNWKQNTRLSSVNDLSRHGEEARVTAGVKAVYNALDATLQLKEDAIEYNWDTMAEILQSPVMRNELEYGCSILKGSSQILSNEARNEIGFHWGSCAWRHCGAQADAEETIAELNNSMGVFEPFECLFTLDIIERALRDILTVVPSQYHPLESKNALKHYVPYQSKTFDSDNETAGEFGNTGSLESDFLNVLSGLRNVYDDKS